MHVYTLQITAVHVLL